MGNDVHPAEIVKYLERTSWHGQAFFFGSDPVALNDWFARDWHDATIDLLGNQGLDKNRQMVLNKPGAKK